MFKKRNKRTPAEYRALDKLIEMGKIHKIESKKMLLLRAETQIVKFLRLLHFQYVKVAKWLMKLVIPSFLNIYQVSAIKKELSLKDLT